MNSAIPYHAADRVSDHSTCQALSWARSYSAFGRLARKKTGPIATVNELIAIERIARWEKLKKLVLDSVSSDRIPIVCGADGCWAQLLVISAGVPETTTGLTVHVGVERHSVVASSRIPFFPQD